MSWTGPFPNVGQAAHSLREADATFLGESIKTAGALALVRLRAWLFSINALVSCWTRPKVAAEHSLELMRVLDDVTVGFIKRFKNLKRSFTCQRTLT